MRRFLLGAVAMVASCTFPDVQFGDGAAPIDTGSEEITTTEAGPDVETDGFDPCDKDHDGHRDMNNGCGGDDCNDNVFLQHPGQAQFITDVPDAAPFGDWNCDGQFEKQYSFTSCGVGTCGMQGFLVDTGCGITNPFVMCGPPLTCPAADAGTRTQGCR